MAPGGQAGTSARIENYPGFPQGISGAELASGAHQQALRFGAEILVGVEIIRAEPRSDGSFELSLSGGGHLRACTGVIATGVAYRRLDAPGVEQLIGCGISYGSAPAKAPGHQDQDVVLVGGANSAGQAALHLAEYARSVTMIIRADSLEAGMSRYLVDRVAAHPRITVLTGTRVIAAGGQPRLESVALVNRNEQRRELPADAMYVLIGGQPLTAGVEGWLRRDDRGYLMTGPDLHRDSQTEWWPLARDPLPLESSQPGVFVAGDVRYGSIKRVASAVGEGAMAIALLHTYLAQHTDGRRACPSDHTRDTSSPTARALVEPVTSHPGTHAAAVPSPTSHRAPMLWGIVVGIIQAATPLAFWWLDDATVYALGLIAIAAIYVGFAVADGRRHVIAIESGVAFGFVVVAAAAITGSPWLLVIGFIGHGLKDLWQHRTHFVANTRWWPPFCLVVDWVLAAIIVVEIIAGQPVR